MAMDAVLIDQHSFCERSNKLTGRIMAVDPGEKRIGLAVSDETGTLARGLCVIKHVSLKQDCLEIAKFVHQNAVTKIIVGSPMAEDGEERPQTRHAKKLADSLMDYCDLQVELWDETGSTLQARAIRIETGSSRDKRSGHLDEVAAAVILQSWLDENNEVGKNYA